MKPVLTDAGNRPNDVDRLIDAAKVEAPRNLLSPYELDEAAAPQLAARVQDVTIDTQRILDAFSVLHAQHDIILVEGIGGIMVPIAKDFFVLDLIALLGLPTVIVTRESLGTINHTLLTVNALRERNIPIAGLIVNHPNSVPSHVSEDRSIAFICEAGNISLLGILQHVAGLDSNWTNGINLLAQHLDTSVLFPIAQTQ